MNTPTLFVVFGATGDLFKRKLYPAFTTLCENNMCANAIIGVGRQSFSDESFREHIYSTTQIHPKNLYYSQLEFTNTQEYYYLKQRIDEFIENYEDKVQIIFYLAVPPQMFSPILQNIQYHGIEEQQKNAEKKIVFEKPFGYDLQSAQELNRDIQNVFSESQIYRIDHYLGKQGVQNFMTLRFANSFFEPIWNNHYIDNVQITAFEQLGIGSRAKYYEESGALKDMVQNHILQMVSYIAMEPPISLDAKHIRDEKVKVFSAINKDEETLRNNSIFGQYSNGTINNESVLGYREEEGVDENSSTETFAMIKFEIDNWRWRGVPFYVRTGKRMNTHETTIVVEFKKIPSILYNKDDSLESNKLIIKIQPDASISLGFNVKGSDEQQSSIMPIHALFNHYECFKHSYQGYEVLLRDIMNSDQSLFTRSDGVEASWRIVEPLIHCRENSSQIHPYKAGTQGPKEAAEFIKKDNRKWN